jgi:hypothetical protein
MRHQGYRVRVVVEQVLLDGSTGDRPGNEPAVVVAHGEATYAIQDIDFSATLANPVAAVIDTMAYDIAPKMGDDHSEEDHARLTARMEALHDAAETVRQRVD